MRVSVLAAALTIGIAATGRLCGLAGAQTAPSPAPSSSPSPHPYRLFAPGPQFLSFGIAVAPRIQTEFRPGSTAAPNGFQLWQTGQTVLLGRFRVVSYNDFRLLGYDHVASDPVVTIGGAGSTIVPAFRVQQNEFESGGGVQLLPHVYAGVAYFAAAGNVGYPHLHGFGYALLVQPEAAAAISPYAQVSYQPNAGGTYALANLTSTALTYRGFRYRGGVLFREPGTRLAFDAGYAGEDLQNRTNAPAAVKDGMLTLGVDVRF